jgi:hypothetical protein
MLDTDPCIILQRKLLCYAIDISDMLNTDHTTFDKKFTSLCDFTDPCIILQRKLLCYVIGISDILNTDLTTFDIEIYFVVRLVFEYIRMCLTLIQKSYTAIILKFQTNLALILFCQNAFVLPSKTVFYL